MKVDNPFDRRLESIRRMPAGMNDAAVFLTDTLDLCWAAAQAVVEDKARPEHAFELLPMFIERAAWERRQLLAHNEDGKAVEEAPVPRLSQRPMG